MKNEHYHRQQLSTTSPSPSPASPWSTNIIIINKVIIIITIVIIFINIIIISIILIIIIIGIIIVIIIGIIITIVIICMLLITATTTTSSVNVCIAFPDSKVLTTIFLVLPKHDNDISRLYIMTIISSNVRIMAIVMQQCHPWISMDIRHCHLCNQYCSHYCHISAIVLMIVIIRYHIMCVCGRVYVHQASKALSIAIIIATFKQPSRILCDLINRLCHDNYS